MEIGLKIGAYLKENGIKQTFLAQVTGLTVCAISDICTGKRKVIDAIEYYKICRALNVALDTFMPDEV